MGLQQRGHAGPLLVSSTAKPRAGMRRRSNAAAPRCARGSLRCSISWPVAKLAALAALAALEQSRRVRSRSARCARAAMSSALLGAAYVAAVAHPPPALPAPRWHASSNTTSVAARAGGATVVGDCAGGGRAAQRLRAARAARVRSSDSPRLFEHSERSERSEFRGAPSARAAQRSRPARPTATVGAPAGHRPPRRARQSHQHRPSTKCPRGDSRSDDVRHHQPRRWPEPLATTAPKPSQRARPAHTCQPFIASHAHGGRAGQALDHRRRWRRSAVPDFCA